MKVTQTALPRWLGAFTFAAALSGCQRPSENPSPVGADRFVQNMSGRFSASITSDHEVTIRYEAPDGIGLTNVNLRALPVWHLQSVLDGMATPTKGVDVHWDSIGPAESRGIDLGEPPQLNDGVTSIHIEGTAELQEDPIRFSLDQSR